jgi:hypothetical protein
MRPKLSVRVNLTSPLFPELKAGGKDAAQRRAPPLFDADLGEPFFAVGFEEQRCEQGGLPSSALWSRRAPVFCRPTKAINF